MFSFNLWGIISKTKPKLDILIVSRRKMCKDRQQNAFTFHHIMPKCSQKLFDVMRHEATRINVPSSSSVLLQLDCFWYLREAEYFYFEDQCIKEICLCYHSLYLTWILTCISHLCTPEIKVKLFFYADIHCLFLVPKLIKHIFLKAMWNYEQK